MTTDHNSGVQEGLLKIVQELLYSKTITAEDDLFEAGLNSIVATQLVARIQREMAVEISLHEIFDQLDSDVFNVSSLLKIIGEVARPEGNQAIARVAPQPLYEVSAAQKRLWLIDKYNNGQYPSSIPVQIVLEEPVDAAGLAAALLALADRHESLRTVFVEQEDGLWQRIVEAHAAGISLSCEEVPGAGEPLDQLLGRIALEEARHIFDLAAGPLLKARLVKAADRYHFFLTVHHIVSDGWSTTILLKELFQLYDANRRREACALPALPIQYKDYAAWHNEKVAGQLGENKAFWEGFLAGPRPRVTLPAYRPRPAVKSHRGKRLHFSFSPGQSRQLAQFSARHDATLFSTLISLLNLLFYRYTGHHRVLLGTSAANRGYGGLEDLVGYFLSVITLKTDLSAADTFLELLEKTRKNLSLSYKHQDYPFDKLVNDLERDRNLSHSPLFDVVVLLHNYENPIIPAEARIAAPAGRKVFETDNETCIVDVFLEFFQYDHGLYLNIRYDTSLFEEAQLVTFFNHLEKLAALVVEQPRLPLHAYNFLTERERRHFTVAPGSVPVPGVHVVSLLEAQVDRQPDATAVVWRDGNLTYAQLHERIHATAGRLRQANPGGEIVAVYLDRSPLLLQTVFAIWKCNAVYLPIEPNNPPERISAILADAGCRVLVTRKGMGQPAAGGAFAAVAHVIDLDEPGEDPAGAALAQAPPPGDLAYVIYTSGSTGIPKGAVVSHEGMLNHLLAKVSDLGIGPGSVVAQNASQGFDISVWQMAAPLIAGGSVAIYDQETVLNPGALLRAVGQDQVTHLQVVPSYLSVLLALFERNEATPSLPALQYLIATGETLMPVLTRKWFGLFPAVPVVNAYGPTEASDDVTHHFLREAEYGERVPIGKPVRNTGIYVLDDLLAPCAEGVTGELYVAGRGVGRGYLNDPEKTSRAFVRHPFPGGGLLYRTGDLGRYRPDGTLEFLGRKDHQVKFRGHRIELGEIEEKLSRLPQVKQAAVLLTEDRADNPVLVACITAAAPLPAAQLREGLRQYLPEHMLPSHVYQFDAIPLTANGKIDRKWLEQSLPRETATGFEAPAGYLEETLAGMWKEVLKADAISATDDFFRAGGYSLLANQLVLRIHERLGVRLELRQLFTHPTIRTLARLISRSARSEYKAISPVEEQDYYQPSHSQKRMWILHHLKKDQIAYNVYGAYRLRGAVDVALLTRAIGTVVGRHEVLRTTFPTVAGSPVQRIHPGVDLAALVTVEDHGGEASEPALAGRLRDLLQAPFDLEAGPLLRVRILRTRTDGVVLFLVLHHIISDGWSRGVLEQEIFEAYANEPGRPQHPARLHYKEYSAWQNNLIRTGQLEGQGAYWLTRLGGDIPALELPVYQSRPAVQTFRGASHSFALPGAFHRAVKAFCQQQEATLFMGLLSVLYLFVHKLSGQKDLILGATVAGRNHPDLEKLIGFFVNTLPLRYQVDPGASFAQTLAGVKALVLEGLASEAYPFDLLIDRLDVERDLSRNAVFDVLVEVHQFDQFHPGLEQFQGQLPFVLHEYSIPEVSSIYDLNLIFRERQDGLNLEIRYNTDLFTSGQVEQFREYLERLAWQVMENERVAIQDLIPFYAGEQWPELQRPGAPGIVPTHPTVVAVIDWQAASHPEAVAIRHNGREVQYGQLGADAHRLGSFLRHTVRVHNPVAGLLMDRSPEMISSILALWRTGKAYLPLDGEAPLDRVRFIIEDAGVELLLFTRQFTKQARLLQWRCPSLRYLVCIDSADACAEAEPLNESMKRELWEYVGETARDSITGGGWIDSYTGEPFTEAEMEEYAENALLTLRPYLHPAARVLEIGCASGLTLFKVAPHVQYYLGTDLSRVIIDRNQARAAAEGATNLAFRSLYAHEVDQLEETGFDIIILNSVIQNFNGYNYLRDVIAKCIGKLNSRGVIYVGDVMDLDRRADLLGSLAEFRRKDENGRYRTKLDWEDELFVPKGFFEDLQHDFGSIREVVFSGKTGTIENELTRFRYDAVLRVDKAAAGSPPAARREKHVFDQSHIAPHAGQTCPDLSGPGEIAYVIYTSGSTGAPKGVLVEQAGMFNHLGAKIHDLGITPRSVIAQNASQHFDISVWQFFAALAAGGQLVIYDKETVRDCGLFLDQLAGHGVTLLEVVPVYLHEMLEISAPHQSWQWASALTHLIVTGETFRKLLLAKWLGQFPGIPVVNAYGPTEASDDVTHFITASVPEREDVPIGTPIQNLRVFIVNAEGALCPPGVKGEIWVAGTGVGRGYINDPEKTAAAFTQRVFDGQVERVYKTGDTGKRNFDGTLSFVGREDQQVKLRGHRIELGEIEQKLLSVREVKEAVALLVQDEQGETSLEAFLVPAGAPPEAQFLRRQLDRWLPEYMIPARFHCLEAFPLNRNGKIDRKLLLQARTHGGASPLADATATERKLLGLWATILNRDIPGLEANFFQIGGHSLKATRLLTHIHREMDTRISLRDIFLHPSLRDLARVIDQADKVGYQGIPRAPLRPAYPLSHAQQRIWVLSQMEGGLHAYSEHGGIEINTRLDPDAFAGAIESLVHRHEILRTTFAMTEGELRQQVHAYRRGMGNLRYVDLRGTSGRDTAVARAVEAAEKTGFDLERGPLTQFSLFRLEEQQFFFLFSAHHILSDGWSGRVFIKDILTFYLYHTGKLSRLPAPLALQYKDFAEWQNALVRKPAMDRHRAYWLGQLGGELPVLDLPASAPRPPVFTHNGNTVRHRFPPALYGELQSLSRQHDASLFMTLVALLNALLYRYTGQTDVLLGTSVAGREHKELEDQIGFYLNTIVLRNTFGAGSTFRALLERVKHTTLGAFEHQQYPFDLLVEALHPKRDLSRSALFDVLVELQNFDQVVAPDPAVDQTYHAFGIRPVAVKKTVSQFDLGWSFYEHEGTLFVDVVYNTDLFSQALVEQYIRHFETMGRQAAGNPEKKLYEYRLPAGAEARHGSTGRPALRLPDVPFIRLFEQQVEAGGGAVAAVCGTRSVTYAQLNGEANRIANFLLAQGAGREALVCVLHERNLTFLSILLGIFKAGCTYVPIDVQNPVARVVSILEDSNAPFLITEAGFLTDDLLPALAGRCAVACILSTTPDGPELPAAAGGRRYRLYGPGALPAGTPPPARPPGGGDLAYVLYTSGSTGRPKGAMIHQAGMLNHLLAKVQELALDQRSVVVQNASQAFDISLWQFLAALLTGGKVVILSHELVLDPAAFLGELRAHRATILEVVPSYLTTLLGAVEALPAKPALSLRYLLVTGETLKASLADAWLGHFPRIPLVNAYGPTEASDDVTHFVVEAPTAGGTVPIGKALPNLHIYIVDPYMNLCPPGVKGEICVGGTGVGRGYLNDPEKTALAFVPDPFAGSPGARLYRTGDVGRCREDGNVEFLGRLDQQVKINGYRIELEEIEKKLSGLPGVVNAAVKGWQHEQGEYYLCGYVQTPAAGQEQVHAIRLQLKKVLPDYMVPAHLVVLPALPLTPNGKVDRAALLAPQVYQPARAAGRPPATPAEEQLVSVWHELFRKPGIGIDEDFFELGGDSIKAIQMVSRLYKKGYQLNIKHVFQFSSIAALAPYLHAGGGADQSPVEGMVPLVPGQLEFFEWHGDNPRHYNLAALLALDHPIDPPGLTAVMGKIQEHHDALRMSFRREDGRFVQTSHPVDYPVSVRYQDLDTRDDWQAALLETAQHTQASVDPAEGPLLKTVLFKVPGGYRLLLVVHHLVFDGVSWRIVLEDLAALLDQYRHGSPLSLGRKTNSFRQWAEKLAGYARSPELQREIPYWRQLEERPAASIRKEAGNGSNLVGDTSLLSVALGPEYTHLLLQAAGRTAGTEVNDLLICALGGAFGSTFGLPEVALVLEGHGRPKLFEDTEVSRTVGWFACEYPVLLPGKPGGAAENLAAIRDALRQVPNGGIGYGVLKYLAGEGSGAFRLRPQVRFNYMGQLDTGTENAPFGIAPEDTGRVHGADKIREYDFEVSAIILQSDLSFTIAYNHHQCGRQTVEKLLECILNNLRGLIDHCLSAGPARPATGGFTYEALSEDELDVIGRLFDGPSN